MQFLWLPDALFAEQRKGVAWVEQKGTGCNPPTPRAGSVSFGGDSATEKKKKHHSFMRAVDSSHIRTAMGVPPLGGGAPAICHLP